HSDCRKRYVVQVRTTVGNPQDREFDGQRSRAKSNDALRQKAFIGSAGVYMGGDRTRDTRRTPRHRTGHGNDGNAVRLAGYNSTHHESSLGLGEDGQRCAQQDNKKNSPIDSQQWSLLTLWRQRRRLAQASAMRSISTETSFGRRATSTVERAGGAPLQNFA